jgi:hypothetical protein
MTPDRKENKLTPPDALWTVVAEMPKNRGRLHIAPESFVSFCGLSNLLVRDFVIVKEGRVHKVGEAGQHFSPISEWQMCKRCLKSYDKLYSKYETK